MKRTLTKQKAAKKNSRSGKPRISGHQKKVEMASNIRARLEAGEVNEKDRWGRTALALAVDTKLVWLVQKVLDSGGDVNSVDKKGNTPLMRAICKHVGIKIIRLLLQAQTNIHLRGKDGQTALSLAARQGLSPKVVKLLVYEGARINDKDNGGFTPLMKAAVSRFSNPRTIEALLDAGADVDIQDALGRRAVDYARESRYLKGTRTLKRLEILSRCA